MENDIIVPQQSGFRTQHSTETLLLTYTNEWLINTDKELLNGILFLVLKLQIYGVEDTDLRWFQSYLDNRKQLCKINHQVSNVQRIRCGVPQGSNLGPLFFLLYINDLPNCLETANMYIFIC